METPFYHGTWAVSWDGGNSASLGSSRPFSSCPWFPWEVGSGRGKVRCCCPLPQCKARHS